MADYYDDDDAETETLTSPGGGRRRQSNNNSNNGNRRGLRGLGRGGQRGNNRNNNNNRRGGSNRNLNDEEEQRRIRKWGPRGVMRRIRGKGIPGQEGEKPEKDSLLTDENGDGGFYDNDPYGDYDEEESRPITGADDEEDDFLDPSAYIDYSESHDQEDNEEEVCGDADDDDEEDSGSEEEEEESDEENDGDEHNENRGDGEWGRYDDEYENKPTGNSSYRDGGGGSYGDDDGGYHDGGGGGSYRDGEGHDNDRGGYNGEEYRGGFGSHPHPNKGRRNRKGPGILRQLNKIRRRSGRRGRGRGRNSSSNLDHTNLAGSGSDPYWNSKADVSGRIEGFGSKPDVEHHRNLREMLKNFRDKRIAARNGEAGMKRMSVGDGPQRKRNFVERIDNAIDALADAALTHPGFDGYMTSTGRKVTKTPVGNTGSKNNPSKQSYLRNQFGDDNAYIIYLEGEKVATELEVISYRNRIKELEAEIRKLKGIEDEDGDSSDSDSSADSDASNVQDERESEIEWQTGVPEEGVLIDIEGTTTAPNSSNEQPTAAVPNVDLLQNEQTPSVVPTADLLQNEPSAEAAPIADLLKTEQSTVPTADLLQTPPEVQTPEKPAETSAAPTPPPPPAEQIQEKAPATSTDAALVDANVRDEAHAIVDSILAGLLNERKVTSLLSDDEDDMKDSLMASKVEPSADEAKNTTSEAPTTDVTTAPSQEETDIAPADLLPEPPTEAPPAPPSEDPPEPPIDVPPEPPADVPQETEVASEETPTMEETEDADATQNETTTETPESAPNTEMKAEE